MNIERCFTSKCTFEETCIDELTSLGVPKYLSQYKEILVNRWSWSDKPSHKVVGSWWFLSRTGGISIR